MPGTYFAAARSRPRGCCISSAGSRPRPLTGPEVLDKVFLSIDDESLPDMARLADGTNELRLYAGHAAWVPGQLQAEINAGGWQVLPATPELVFHADPGSLWMELEGRGGSGGNFVAAIAAH